METTHQVEIGDARDLPLADESVELVVTSPPYPMIDIWDGVFSELDPAIAEHLAANDGQAAFDAMHAVLDAAWDEVERVLAPGGIVCINVGDATRTVGDRFQVYSNHVRITEAFVDRGFDPLPDAVWHKPANSAAKFMGSGMLPPNAYITLEHEHILVFRKGERRSFDPGADRRYKSAFFWEERNRWFSDVWTDVRGRFQDLDDDDLRDRSGAFPFTIPYRLINMYSVYGDTVLDPFWGTGTTSLAAMVAGRDSVGIELEPEFLGPFEQRLSELPELSRAVVEQRIADHEEFVADHDGALDYETSAHELAVKTAQEESLQLFVVDAVNSEGEGVYRVRHVPYEGDA